MDELHQNGLPELVEVEALTFLSPDTARRLLSGFRAMGWIDKVGIPSEELRTLVKAKNTPEWESILRAVLQKSYSFIPGDWEQLTAAQLSAAFREYTGRDDEALNGAQTFFIAAAAEAGFRLASELAVRASRARGDNSVNLKFRKATAKPESNQMNRQERANGAANPNANADVAQILDLLASIDDAEMTDKEKSAALTVLAYLKRRADRKRGPRA
jgi:hypothetical protein